MDGDREYTIREASEFLGVPVRSLRNFCDKGLIPGVSQDENGYRLVLGKHSDLVKLLYCLVLADSTAEDLERLASLYRQDDGISVSCQEILRTKKRQLWQKIKEIQSGIDLIECYEEIFDKSGDL